jgi:hypothetical protein
MSNRRAELEFVSVEPSKRADDQPKTNPLSAADILASIAKRNLHIEEIPMTLPVGLSLDDIE